MTNETFFTVLGAAVGMTIIKYFRTDHAKVKREKKMVKEMENLGFTPLERPDQTEP